MAGLVLTGTASAVTSPLTATILSLSNNGSGAVRVLTSAPHLFGNGDTVRMSDIGHLIGDYVITVVGSTTFDLVGSTYTSTGTGTAKDLSLTPQVQVPIDGMTGSLQQSGMLSTFRAILDRTQALMAQIVALWQGKSTGGAGYSEQTFGYNGTGLGGTPTADSGATGVIGTAGTGSGNSGVAGFGPFGTVGQGTGAAGIGLAGSGSGTGAGLNVSGDSRGNGLGASITGTGTEGGAVITGGTAGGDGATIAAGTGSGGDGAELTGDGSGVGARCFAGATGVAAVVAGNGPVLLGYAASGTPSPDSLYANNIIKAYGSFSIDASFSTATLAEGSFGVVGVAIVGASVAVTVSNAFANTNYTVVVGSGNGGSLGACATTVIQHSTTVFYVAIANEGGGAISAINFIAVGV